MAVQRFGNDWRGSQVTDLISPQCPFHWETDSLRSANKPKKYSILYFFLLQTYIDHFSTIFLQHTLSATHVEKLTTWLTQPHLAKILVSFWSGEDFLKHFLLLTEFSGTFIFCWPNWLTHPFLPLALPGCTMTIGQDDGAPNWTMGGGWRWRCNPKLMLFTWNKSWVVKPTTLCGRQKKVRGVILDTGAFGFCPIHQIWSPYKLWTLCRCVILDWYGTCPIHEICTLCCVQCAYRKLVAYLIRLFQNREI